MSEGRLRTQGPRYITAGSLGSATQYFNEYWNRGWWPIGQLGPLPSTDMMWYNAVCLDELHPGPPYRTGGPFYLCRETLTGSTGSFYLQGGLYRCVGPCCLLGANALTEHRPEGFTAKADGTLDPDMSYGKDDLLERGATGWNKYRPDKPQADLGVFLGELREVPRMVSQTADFFRRNWQMPNVRLSDVPEPGSRWFPRFRKVYDHLRDGASDWLNLQFGWKPFLADVFEILDTMANLDGHLSRIYDYGNTWERRGGIVDEESETSSETVLGSFGYQVLPRAASQCYDSSSFSTTTTVTTTRRTWFEASFRYYVPGMTGQMKPGDLQELYLKLKLWGLIPTPSVLWELLPFSWLVDWVSNAGDVIENISLNFLSNIGARYAYVMQHTTHSVTIESSALGADEGSQSIGANLLYESKVRVAASPLGFGLTLEDFTPRQWSILAALGLTRNVYLAGTN